MDTRNTHNCFGGTQGYYSHVSDVVGGTMNFSVFTPPQASTGKVPVVWYLSGLTCTEDNATVKAGFQKLAAELGLMIVCPDTSPRGDDVPNDDAYDLGQGAGFYVNATQEPWAKNFQMYSYVTGELHDVVMANFAADPDRQGIMGHSMGGHGALTIGLKNPARYKSISAFSPIVAPMDVPWGQKAFAAYLGYDQSTWDVYDACRLVAAGAKSASSILIDQGSGDPFLAEQLQPERFEEACKGAGQAVNVRLHEGYDHSYFFISTFMDDHLRHHAKALI